MPEQSRDTLRAWPIVDGPMQGQTWAHADDYFYAADLVLPAFKPQPDDGHRHDAPTGRTLYRLRLDKPGFYVWTCRT